MARDGIRMSDRILVIKLGPLPELMQALGSFAAIREMHSTASITLLTAEPFVELMEESGLFDLIVPGVSGNSPRERFELARSLLRERYSSIYDLERPGRAGIPGFLFGMRTRRLVNGSRVRHPGYDRLPAQERFQELLRQAGFGDIPRAGFPPLKGPLHAGLPEHYAVLIEPEGGAGGVSDGLGGLGEGLHRRGLAIAVVESGQPAVPGAAPEGSVRLPTDTSLVDLARIFQRARLVVGVNSDRLFLSAATGALTLVLLEGRTDRLRNAPRGNNVQLLEQSGPQAFSAPELTSAALGLLGNREKR